MEVRIVETVPLLSKSTISQIINCGDDARAESSADVACEVYEPLPVMEAKCMPSTDDSLDDDDDERSPLRLRRWIDAVVRGLLRYHQTGETYSFKVTGLSELNHRDLTTMEPSSNPNYGSV